MEIDEGDVDPVPVLQECSHRRSAVRDPDLSAATLQLADQGVTRQQVATRCQEVFNRKGKTSLVATHAVSRGTSSLTARGDAPEYIGKFIANMRKVQELPPWDDRDFCDRRYVWAFRGTPLVSAKDEGDYFFQQIPVEQLLGKR